MDPSTKRGYLWSAIIFLFSPLWGLIQAALTFGADKAATHIEESRKLAPFYRILEGPQAGRTIKLTKHEGGRVWLTDAAVPGDVLICPEQDVHDALAAGRIEAIYVTQ
jgi:hypothetical protein